MNPADDLHPLLFQPIFKEKVWGGRRLEQLKKALPADVPIGESWEIADLDSTSPTGGGGDAAHSIIINGSQAGMPLRDVVNEWGANLLGNAQPTAAGGFPLLIKFLDASDNLSVQTHPSPAFAQSHVGADLKHEAWCVIAAEPGAVIYRGLHAGVTREEVRRRINDGSLADALVKIPSKTGEIIHLPSGCVHALGAGVLVAEVQTPSDTTYRLYDWGRSGRTLHIEESLACAFDEAGRQTVPVDLLPAPSMDTVTTDAFSIQRTEHRKDESAPIALAGKSPCVWMILDGEVTIESARSAFEPVHLQTGSVSLLPAKLTGASAHFTRNTSLLSITIPTV